MSTPSTGNNVFSSPASPAFIIAFVAIGVFAGGLFAMMFLRRFAFAGMLRRRYAGGVISWNVDPRNHGRGVRRHKLSMMLGEKPVLWDLHVAPNSNTRGWAGLMPLAVTFTPKELDYDEPLATYSSSSSSSSAHRPFTKLSQGHVTSTTSESTSQNIRSGELQIAVAIVMPSSVQRVGEQDVLELIPELELGFLPLPWDSQKMEVIKMGSRGQEHIKGGKDSRTTTSNSQVVR